MRLYISTFIAGRKMGKARTTRKRARLDFKQRNVSRLMRACEVAGKEIGAVEITKDGTIRVIVGKAGERTADSEVENWLSKQGQHENQR
jgi:hypothetical protein